MLCEYPLYGSKSPLCLRLCLRGAMIFYMGKIKFVFFDMDGTLLNTLEDLHEALNHTLAEMGFPLKTLEETRNYVGNGIFCLVERGLPENAKDLAKEGSERFKKYYRAHLTAHTRPYDGIKELLGELNARGIRIGIVSNKSQQPLEELTEYFFKGKPDVVTGFTDGIPAKPAPDMLFAAMSAVGADKENSLYAGDSAVDVETARNAGVKGVFCAWGFAGKERLIKAGARPIIDAPEDLLDYLD